jgi:hypothetical protein
LVVVKAKIVWEEDGLWNIIDGMTYNAFNLNDLIFSAFNSSSNILSLIYSNDVMVEGMKKCRTAWSSWSECLYNKQQISVCSGDRFQQVQLPIGSS